MPKRTVRQKATAGLLSLFQVFFQVSIVYRLFETHYLTGQSSSVSIVLKAKILPHCSLVSIRYCNFSTINHIFRNPTGPFIFVQRRPEFREELMCMDWSFEKIEQSFGWKKKA